MPLIIIAAIIFFVIQSDIIEEILASSKSISEVTCDDIEALAEKQTFQNVFGGEIDVIKITGTYEHSRNETAVRCIGEAHLSNGRVQTLVMRAYDDSEGDRLYEFRSQ
ncbi:MAG: hypothetical protein ACQEUZ_02295 [Pseudomonadota bacterium]